MSPKRSRSVHPESCSSAASDSQRSAAALQSELARNQPDQIQSSIHRVAITRVPVSPGTVVRAPFLLHSAPVKVQAIKRHDPFVGITCLGGTTHSLGYAFHQLAIHHEQCLLRHKRVRPLGGMCVGAREVERAKHVRQVLAVDVGVERAPCSTIACGDVFRFATNYCVSSWSATSSKRSRSDSKSSRRRLARPHNSFSGSAASSSLLGVLDWR